MSEEYLYADGHTCSNCHWEKVEHVKMQDEPCLSCLMESTNELAYPKWKQIYCIVELPSVGIANTQAIRAEMKVPVFREVGQVEVVHMHPDATAVAKNIATRPARWQDDGGGKIYVKTDNTE
jgi:hypothetical protein